MKKIIGFLLLCICCSVQANIPAWTNGHVTGISTQGGSTQTQWNTANSQSATVQQDTNAIAQINNNDLKARQLNRNEASLMDQAKANIHNNTTLSAEQKQQASADLNALACAAVQCAAGVSKNDPLYEQVSQLQAQGEALKAKGEDIVSSLGVYGVDVKAADSDFAYSRIDQMDDLITSNEQTVARAGQITQGVAGAAEAAGGVALSGTGLGAVIGVPLAGLGAYDMADASDKLGTPHTYQSGQNVLNSFSLDTHGGNVNPTFDAAFSLGIDVSLGYAAKTIAKHSDDIGEFVGGVFKKGDNSNISTTVGVSSDTGKYANRIDVVYTTAGEANGLHTIKGNRPPYQKGTQVTEYTTKQDDIFVRVHNDENQARSWMMRKEAIEGLTAEQIQHKYSLPSKPKFISDVSVPAGTRIRTGKVESNFDLQGGGGQGATQYELLDRLEDKNFINKRLIGR